MISDMESAIDMTFGNGGNNGHEAQGCVSVNVETQKV
jgi:hypothetical protein